MPQPNSAYIKRALLDENAQVREQPLVRSAELVVSLAGVLLVPAKADRAHDPAFCNFLRLPHPSVAQPRARADRTVTFVRTTFLPKPPAAAKDGKTAPAPTSAGAQLSKQIQTLVKTHYEHAVRPSSMEHADRPDALRQLH